MEKVHDFLFGDMAIGEEGLIIREDKIVKVAKKVPAEFFTDSLNRLLKDHGGHLTVTGGGSGPEFAKLIDKVSRDRVGVLSLYPRTDINSSNVVPCTLACDITLLNGVVSVRAHWTAYKDTRAEELTSTLLMPIYLKGLKNRTLLGVPGNDPEVLSGPYGDALYELKAVLRLAKASPICLSKERLQHHGKRLQAADRVSEYDLPIDQAFEKVDAVMEKDD